MQRQLELYVRERIGPYGRGLPALGMDRLPIPTVATASPTKSTSSATTAVIPTESTSSATVAAIANRAMGIEQL